MQAAQLATMKQAVRDGTATRATLEREGLLELLRSGALDWDDDERVSWMELLVERKFGWPVCGALWIALSDAYVPTVLYNCLRHYHTEGIHALLRDGHLPSIWHDARFWDDRGLATTFFRRDDRFMRRTIFRQLLLLPRRYRYKVPHTLVEARSDSLLAAYVKAAPPDTLPRSICHECVKECMPRALGAFLTGGWAARQDIGNWLVLFLTAFAPFRGAAASSRTVDERRQTVTQLLDGFGLYAAARHKDYADGGGGGTFEPPWCTLCLQVSGDVSLLDVVVCTLPNASGMLQSIFRCMQAELGTWRASLERQRHSTDDAVRRAVRRDGSNADSQDADAEHARDDSDDASDDSDVERRMYVEMYEGVANGIAGLFQALEPHLQSGDGWTLLANAVRWGDARTVRWILRHCSSPSVCCYSYSMCRAHSVLSLAMYNSRCTVVREVLQRVPRAELQYALDNSAVDVVHGAHRVPGSTRRKLKMLLADERLDFALCKGDILSAHERLTRSSPQAAAGHECRQRILGLRASFGAEHVYESVRGTPADALAANLTHLVGECGMRNLPRLFFLLLSGDERAAAAVVQAHPLFAHEIACQDDKFRCAMLMYTLSLRTAGEIESWFDTMRYAWRWHFASVHWLAQGTEQPAWRHAAMRHGVRLTAEEGSPWFAGLRAAFALLRRFAQRQYLRRRHRRKSRWLHFELLCRVEARLLDAGA